MTETCKRTVRIDPQETPKSRIWGYGVATVASKAGVHVEIVRRAIRLGRLDMSDLMAVASWISARKLGVTHTAIAKRARCGRGVVDAAVASGALNCTDVQSVQMWLANRQQAGTRPSPGIGFTRFSLLRSKATLRHGAAQRKGRRRALWTDARVGLLVEELRTIGFAAQRRGPNHIFIRPDLWFVPDAQRLLDTMNRHGWQARAVNTSARRWLAIFGGIALPKSLDNLSRKRSGRKR